jgi:hypothetical protein
MYVSVRAVFGGGGSSSIFLLYCTSDTKKLGLRGPGHPLPYLQASFFSCTVVGQAWKIWSTPSCGENCSGSLVCCRWN